MVNKDSSEKDSTDKKRRKTSTAESSAKQVKEDGYEAIIAHEEQEALRRTPERDMSLFHLTCNELKKIFDEILALKKESPDKAKQEILDKRIQGSLTFVALKKLNRLDKIRIREGRDALHKEKLRVDSNRLQLQNLLYEANHLKREVERCYQFKSQDEEIELIDEGEFYKTAPDTISRPDKTLSDEHARRLARLEWELHQRKELSSLCKDLSIAKDEASKGISSKTERLNSLAPFLEALLKATRPLQSALEMDIEKDWEVHRSARLLPRPLYLVYANLSAYAEACDSNLIATIEGDEEEAKQIDEELPFEQQDDDDNQESDNEDNDAENRKKHHKRQSKTETLNIKRKALMKPHPLSVTFLIKCNEENFSLSVILKYFPCLGFVTARTQTTAEYTSTAASDVISSETMLKCLYANDFGEESPNPKTKYQLAEFQIDSKQLMDNLAEQNAGKPFRWSQRLCGIAFVGESSLSAGPSRLNASTRDEISHELAESSVPEIIRLIKSRWNSRISLYKQIHQLENKNIELSPKEMNESLVRISSSLVQWASISFDEYAANPLNQKFIDDNLVGPHDLYYRAIITRGSAKLECQICVSSEFPAECPLWTLCLSWNGKHDATNNQAVRDMEYWINSVQSRKSSNMILSKQLRRTMSCLDIFLETEGPHYSPAEFTQDKTFLKAFQGRQRARPYKVVQTGSSTIFKQI